MSVALIYKTFLVTNVEISKSNVLVHTYEQSTIFHKEAVLFDYNKQSVINTNYGMILKHRDEGKKAVTLTKEEKKLFHLQ